MERVMNKTDGNPVESWWPRRDVLQAGALGVSASALAGLGLDPVHAAGDLPGRAKSVIYLWVGGGMTHIDSGAS